VSEEFLVGSLLLTFVLLPAEFMDMVVHRPRFVLRKPEFLCVPVDGTFRNTEFFGEFEGATFAPKSCDLLVTIVSIHLSS